MKKNSIGKSHSSHIVVIEKRLIYLRETIASKFEINFVQAIVKNVPCYDPGQANGLLDNSVLPR